MNAVRDLNRQGRRRNSSAGFGVLQDIKVAEGATVQVNTIVVRFPRWRERRCQTRRSAARCKEGIRSR